MLWFYIILFLACCVALYFSGNWIIEGLMRISRFLGWREFVVAFFIMALAGSLPNLFVGLASAFNKIPQLSFGDVVGGNVIDLTLAISLAVLIAGGIPAGSRMVQTSTTFTIVAAILPILLILDGVLGRGDGMVLILTFTFYTFWLFSKKERFAKSYEGYKPAPIQGFKNFFKDFGKIILGLMILAIAAEGIVRAAKFFAFDLGIDIALIGILVVALGNAIPETYFSALSAKKGETWMILGDLMGAIIVPSTLVLGIVALICPIEIPDFSPFAIARLFLLISALFFFFAVKTDRQITRKEGVVLLGLYIVFVLAEIFFN